MRQAEEHAPIDVILFRNIIYPRLWITPPQISHAKPETRGALKCALQNASLVMRKS